jgi:hypothetical protein
MMALVILTKWLMQEKYELKVTGERFKVAEGQLGAIVGASLGLILRPGSAITVAGYKPSLGEKKEGQYTLQTVGNRMIEESSSVRFQHIPAISIPSTLFFYSRSA